MKNTPRRIEPLQPAPAILLLAVFFLVSCASATAAPPTAMSFTPAAVVSAPPATDLPPTHTAPPTPAQAETYDNPIYPGDFPDPFILEVGDSYYAYSTNSAGANVPVLKLSEDFSKAEKLGDALPELPKWAAKNQSLTWAPAVLPRDGRFILYYTARYVLSGRQCISRAVSDYPEGPFVDDSQKPFVCQIELGGSIDPSPFVDQDGDAYLLWKNDGNCCGKPVGIWIGPLSEDGLSLSGEPQELIRRDLGWEDPLIEGPAMVADGGEYYLFYSGNWWESESYAIGYAICDTPQGPCVKPVKKPWFQHQGNAVGTGGADFFHDDEGQLWMAYHAWTAPDIGYPEGARSLRIEPVQFSEGGPVTNGPTEDPQPIP